MSVTMARPGMLAAASSKRRTRGCCFMDRSLAFGRDDSSDCKHAAGYHLGPQSAAMLQSLLDAAARQLLQMSARLAQPDAAQHDRADGERLADEMVERHAARQQVAASLERLERDFVF